MIYDWEAVRIEDPDIDERCWVNLREEVPCDKPAPNGAGLCDYHLELLREKGR